MTDTKKVRLGNWISPTAKAHLKQKAQEKKLPESTLLEVAIMKLK
jgi:hypothetical protein